MKKYQMNVQDLPALLKNLSSNWNWMQTDYDKHYKNNPLPISIYREILNFSKEELESVKDPYNIKHYHIWNTLLSYPEPLVFSAIVEKGAFRDSMSSTTLKLLNHISEDTSIEYYALAGYFNRNSACLDTILNFLKDMDTPEKQRLTPLLFQDFFTCVPGKENFERNFKMIIDFCFSEYSSPLSSFLLEQLEQSHIDINRDKPLQCYLNKKESYSDINSYHKLFISSLNIPKIAVLLKKGFRFEEKEYRYFCHNESLFTALIKSEREDMITTILPYLENVIPHDNNQEKQTALVESLREKTYYDFVSSHYYRYLLESKLEQKSSVYKPKI